MFTDHPRRRENRFVVYLASLCHNALSHLILQQPYKANTIFISALQMSKLRLREERTAVESVTEAGVGPPSDSKTCVPDLPTKLCFFITEVQ